MLIEISMKKAEPLPFTIESLWSASPSLGTPLFRYCLPAQQASSPAMFRGEKRLPNVLSVARLVEPPKKCSPPTIRLRVPHSYQSSIKSQDKITEGTVNA